jgi:hypothetical protein
MLPLYFVGAMVSLTSVIFSHINADIHHSSKEHLAKYAAWLDSYKAPKPENQEFCHNALKTGQGSSSQFGQDLFLFFNIFKFWPMENRKGFYIDSGTNDPVIISNSHFYDICLGWDGLCVEPEKIYHAGITEKRTCVLIKECISDSVKYVNMGHDGALSKVKGVVSEGDPDTVKCSPLKDMLLRHPKYNTTAGPYKAVDLWSLDVEGHEMTVLSTINFKDIEINTILTEEMWLSTRELDRKLNEVGFIFGYYFFCINAECCRYDKIFCANHYYYYLLLLTIYFILILLLTAYYAYPYYYRMDLTSSFSFKSMLCMSGEASPLRRIFGMVPPTMCYGSRRTSTERKGEKMEN